MITDFLNQLSVSLPSPIFGLVVAIIILSLLFLFGIGLYILFAFLQRVPGLSFLFVDLDETINRSLQPKPRRPRGKVSRSYRNDPRNRHLQADLLALLKGDVGTAKRLLSQQRRLNPGKSDNWYLEKVIWDLERDRH